MGSHLQNSLAEQNCVLQMGQAQTPIYSKSPLCNTLLPTSHSCQTQTPIYSKSPLCNTLLPTSHSCSFFRLLPSRVATADFPSPVVPNFCILLRHFNLSHVLFHHIHKPPFWPSLFPHSWQFHDFHPQHPSPNTPIIFPLYMSKPPQSCLVFSPNHPVLLHLSFFPLTLSRIFSLHAYVLPSAFLYLFLSTYLLHRFNNCMDVLNGPVCSNWHRH